MFEWLRDNHQIATTFVNLGMLGVWLAYLQLFLQNYRRQRRAHILINRSAGSDLDARCLISNMSAEAIYIESIIASLDDSGETLSYGVTDVMPHDGDKKPLMTTRQGPISSGNYIDVGTFRGMVEQVLQNGPHDGRATPGIPDRPFALEVLVIADYASENLVIGAKKRFEVTKGPDQWLLKPCSPRTDQVRTRRARRRLQALQLQHL